MGPWPLPLASSINETGGQPRSNHAVLSLGASGQLVIRSDQASGTIHAVLDPAGDFE